MFKPKYQISNKLLSQIKQITRLVIKLNQQKLPHVILTKLEKNAAEISSFASTSIEGNPLPLTEVKKILKSKPEFIQDSQREVINYNQALTDLNKKLKSNELKLTKTLILQIHQHVTRGLLPKHQSGLFRKQPVFVRDPRTGSTIFLPPNHQEVDKLTTDLVKFVQENKKKIDPLIIAGIFHKQMVLIHPFMDGNGRTTRLITKLLLARLGLNTFNLFSFESYYNKNITKYFKFVGEQGDYYNLVNTIDFTSWLEYFCEGIIDELLRVQKTLSQVNPSPKTELGSHHQKILKFIEKNGYITDKHYSKLVERAKATRSLDFKKLIKLGLIQRKGKGRSTYYIIKDKP